MFGALMIDYVEVMYNIRLAKLKALAALKELENLPRDEEQSLCFNNLEFDEANLESLNEKLKYYDQLIISLTFTLCRFFANHILQLIPTFTDIVGLTSLDLSHNQLGNNGAEALAGWLEKNPSLTSLNVKANDIQEEGAKCIAQSLEKNLTLQLLGLGHNSIQSNGMSHLAHSLSKNSTLIALLVGFNEITQEGVISLAQTLRTNTSITLLDLEMNYSYDKGGCELADLLKANTTLRSLDISDNGFSNAVKNLIVNAAITNTTLTSLNLGDDQFDSKLKITLENNKHLQSLVVLCLKVCHGILNEIPRNNNTFSFDGDIFTQMLSRQSGLDLLNMRALSPVFIPEVIVIDDDETLSTSSQNTQLPNSLGLTLLLQVYIRAIQERIIIPNQPFRFFPLPQISDKPYQAPNLCRAIIPVDSSTKVSSQDQSSSVDNPSREKVALFSYYFYLYQAAGHLHSPQSANNSVAEERKTQFRIS